MKDLRLLIWLTQLGLSVAVPLAGFILLGVWLHSSLGLGVWTIFSGILLGAVSAVRSFRSTVSAMERMSGQKKPQSPPPVSFNEHN